MDTNECAREHSLALYHCMDDLHTHSPCITVWMTSCLTGLDLTQEVKLLFIKHKQSSLIKTKKQVSPTVIFPLKFVFS